MIAEIVVAVALLIGAFFTLVGSIGLVRFPDFLSRLHAPTKATTLGLGAILAASLIHFGTQSGQAGLRELLVILFLFMSAPVGAYLLAKVARHLEAHAASAAEADDRVDPS
jgi:multicomponent K+:H+ antiporter subunit G